MAKIRDYAVTTEAVATASMVMNMPIHQTGDLLVAFVNKDTNSNFTTPSGWTAVQTQTSAGDDSRAFSIAIRPATSGMTRDGYIPLSTTPARQISPMNGSTGAVDKGSWDK